MLKYIYMHLSHKYNHILFTYNMRIYLIKRNHMLFTHMFTTYAYIM
uniref:Host translation inhibitor E66L n=1 Tax=African swine fever virus (isolate Tick/South Africa/Pretoriuskop Pr4/1996) TaxID=561443 RepID=VFE66_ASFP4|nr:RecName: Full=Host translation inhibitor E66L; Short=pE66L [African swine fever virus tick/South Africa/Pretoriuskop Pr4/1996]